jgi:hypothetical protein
VKEWEYSPAQLMRHICRVKEWEYSPAQLMRHIGHGENGVLNSTPTPRRSGRRELSRYERSKS